MSADSAIAKTATPVNERRAFSNYIGRSHKGSLGEWFWEIDRVLLLLVTILISIGLIGVAAASPAAAERYSGDMFQFHQLHYFYRQLIWFGVGVPVMLIISTMPKEFAKRLALAGAVCIFILLLLVPLLGNEVNGARRWIGYGTATLQPSEFLKPFFIVATAWLLSLRVTQDPTLPVVSATAILTGLIALLLMRQPDFGQTVIFGTAWIVMLMISGVSTKILGGFTAVGVAGLGTTYFFYPVATTRINNFLFAEGDSYQVDNAMRTLTNGGFFGVGPGDGEMKYRLPEPHTDYIFSVIGEELGLVTCLAIALIFGMIVVRVFVKLIDEENIFYLLASAGLATQLAIQALINMAVNLDMAPSKGMTLPFISYGGSSIIALSIGFGLLLAFTRRNPHLPALDKRL